MTTSVTVRAIYDCSLERAFKTPILCDVSKIHTGFVIMPKVTHCTDDEHWGKPGYSKKVFAARSFFQKGGWISNDTVIERIENRYWKIEVSNFKTWFLGFTKFVGEWQTKPLDTNRIQITYTYTLHAAPVIFYPFHWLFTKTFWRLYMKRVIRNIRILVDKEEPYLFE